MRVVPAQALFEEVGLVDGVDEEVLHREAAARGVLEHLVLGAKDPTGTLAHLDAPLGGPEELHAERAVREAHVASHAPHDVPGLFQDSVQEAAGVDDSAHVRDGVGLVRGLLAVGDLEHHGNPVHHPCHGVELKAVVVLLHEDGAPAGVRGHLVKALLHLARGVQKVDAVGAPAVEGLGHHREAEGREVLSHAPPPHDGGPGIRDPELVEHGLHARLVPQDGQALGWEVERQARLLGDGGGVLRQVVRERGDDAVHALGGAHAGNGPVVADVHVMANVRDPLCGAVGVAVAGDDEDAALLRPPHEGRELRGGAEYEKLVLQGERPPVPEVPTPPRERPRRR